MGFKLEQKRTDPIPGGEYLATIKDFQEAEGKYGLQFKIIYEVAEGPYIGRQIIGWCSQVFSSKSNLYQITRAAFNNRVIPPTWTFDSDYLIGRKVVLSVVRRVSDKDGQEFNKVDAVLPVPRGGSNSNGAATQPQPPAPEPAPDPVAEAPVTRQSLEDWLTEEAA